MLQVYRALFHDLIYNSYLALLYWLKPYRLAVLVYRPLHPDPPLYLHGTNRGLQIAYPTSASCLAAFDSSSHICDRLCANPGSHSDIHVLLHLEARFLQTL
jgi:hypothetical protein